MGHWWALGEKVTQGVSWAQKRWVNPPPPCAFWFLWISVYLLHSMRMSCGDGLVSTPRLTFSPSTICSWFFARGAHLPLEASTSLQRCASMSTGLRTNGCTRKVRCWPGSLQITNSPNGTFVLRTELQSASFTFSQNFYVQVPLCSSLHLHEDTQNSLVNLFPWSLVGVLVIRIIKDRGKLPSKYIKNKPTNNTTPTKTGFFFQKRTHNLIKSGNFSP